MSIDQIPTAQPQGAATNLDPRYQYATQDPRYQYYYQDPQAAQASQQPSSVGAWFDFKDSRYVKGFVIGAAVALVAANPTVQKAIVSGSVKLWNAVQGGMEEVKEQVKDIKAEISHKD